MSSRSPDLSLVVPAFDEVDRIEVAIKRIGDFLTTTGLAWELVVVIDGGPPVMASLAQRAAEADVGQRVRVLVNDRNHGKGYSVRRGILATTGRVVGFLDADLAQPVEALPAFLGRMAEGAQVAIGTRKVAGHRTGVVRRIASALFGRLARAVLSLPFSDTQCGMKVFEGSSGRSLFAAQRLHGFAFDAELLWLAERWRLRVVEVPLIVIPPASSTVRVLRDGSHMLWELLRVRWFALRGKYGPPPA